MMKKNNGFKQSSIIMLMRATDNSNWLTVSHSGYTELATVRKRYIFKLQHAHAAMHCT